VYNERGENTDLIEKAKKKSAKIGITRLGYVGLPLAIEFGKDALDVTGFDLDPEKAEALNEGKSYVTHIPPKGACKKTWFYADNLFPGTKRGRLHGNL
jgi:UDP-N-acetyl-D-mannosaminuronate dehydrogenase